jgi:hypothetical protein
MNIEELTLMMDMLASVTDSAFTGFIIYLLVSQVGVVLGFTFGCLVLYTIYYMVRQSSLADRDSHTVRNLCRILRITDNEFKGQALVARLAELYKESQAK